MFRAHVHRNAYRSYPMSASPTTQGWRHALEPLRNAQYGWLYISNMAFFFALQAQIIVRLLLVWELTHSKTTLGITSILVAIPMVIISPIGGVISDRIDRRKLILWGQGALALTELGMLVLIATGAIAYWHILIAAFVLGCVIPLIMPARMALAINIVGPDAIGRASALTSGGINAMRVIAPAMAGFLVVPLGIGGTYSISVSLYFIAFLCLLRVHPAPPIKTSHQLSIGRDVLYSARYVLNHRPLLVVMIFGLLPMFLAMPFQALLVVFADEVWSVGERGFGILQATAGIGGVLGAAFAARQGESPRRLKAMLVSVLGFGGFLLLFSASPYFLLALPLVLIADVFASIFSTFNQTIIQMLIPDAVRGRISGFLMMSFGLTPLGTLPMALIAEYYGAPIAIGSACFLMIVLSIVAYLLSSTLRKIDDTTEAIIEGRLLVDATGKISAAETSA